MKRVYEIAKAPGEIMRNLFIYRHILMQMVRREIKGRFAGSAGGFLWNFLHPVLMLIMFLFVFVYIFKMRVGSGGSGTSALYLMAGLFPWIIIAEGLSRGTASLVENATLIQKTAFPTEILAAKAVVTPFFSYGVALLLLALYKVATAGSVAILLFLPAVVIVQVFFTLGIAFLTSTLSVFFRDVLQLMQVLISFWIYATPILYPMSLLPEWARTVMYFNPLYPLVSVFQSLFVYGTLAQADVVLMALGWAVLFFVSGAFVFNKLRYEFADWL